MSRIVGWIMVLLVIGAVAACGSSSSSKNGINGPSEAPGKAPAAGTGAAPTQTSPAGTGTTAAASSAGASPSPAVVKPCLQQEGLSITENTRSSDRTADWKVSSSASSTYVSDYKTAAGLETKAHLLKRPLQADVLGTYLVGPYDKSVSADRDLATKIERCIH